MTLGFPLARRLRAQNRPFWNHSAVPAKYFHNVTRCFIPMVIGSNYPVPEEKVLARNIILMHDHCYYLGIMSSPVQEVKTGSGWVMKRHRYTSEVGAWQSQGPPPMEEGGMWNILTGIRLQQYEFEVMIKVTTVDKGICVPGDRQLLTSESCWKWTG